MAIGLGISAAHDPHRRSLERSSGEGTWSCRMKTSSQPPRLATWLVKRFGVAVCTDPLIGDLLEEFIRGRSRLWYWKQALRAIVIGVYQDIRTHKLLAIRGALTGFAVLFVAGRLLFVFLLPFAGPEFYALHIALESGICVATAWIVGQLHRPHQSAMMFVWFTVTLSLGVPEFLRTLMNAMSDDRYVPYFVGYSEQFIRVLAATALGSILSIIFSGRSAIEPGRA
jgi:hypothetical protein